METWVWRHIRIELPEDWEMLQFSRNPQAGRCAWADRYQFRAELNWQQVSGPPDLARLASDYLAKLRLDGGVVGGVSTRREHPRDEDIPPTTGDMAPTLARVGDWHGLRGHEGGLLASRFTGYLASESSLIELVLLWPGGLDEKLEESILGSIRPEPPWPGAMRRWRAFGLDLLASEGLDLVECSVEPARAQLVFRDARGTRQEAFQRLGMVQEWLRTPVRDWLARQLPDGVAVTAEAATEASGHAVMTLSGRRKAAIARRASSVEAAAWICPADGRLYGATMLGIGAVTALDLPGKRLSCCEGMRLGG